MDTRVSVSLPEGSGPWLASELDRHGLGGDARRRLLADRELVRVRRGVYVGAERSHSSTPETRAAEHLAAHLRITRSRHDPAYMYSHTSAARLWELHLLRDSALIHVSCDSKPCARRLGPGVRAHFIPVPGDQQTILNGVRVTTLERTVIDCARIMPVEDSLVLADQALARGADRAHMARILAALSGHRGVINSRLVVAFADPRSESVAETRARLLFHLENIPAPVPQWKVMTPLGQRYLDFAWPEEMVAAEFDGMVKYFGDKPTDRALYEERLRERHLMELGWRFVRLTWSDLDRPGEVRRRITAALREPDSLRYV